MAPKGASRRTRLPAGKSATTSTASRGDLDAPISATNSGHLQRPEPEVPPPRRPSQHGALGYSDINLAIIDRLTTSSSRAAEEMADPFEVRVRFSSQLQNLNASVTSAQKAAAFAMKYKDMDEDLHSCILEQLEKPSTPLNTRANIMYFLEHLLELAHKEGHIDYVRMIQRDIIRVVDAVAPEDGSGAANVKVVRKVLQGLQQKNFLEAQAVTEIEEVLKERETAMHDVGLSSPAGFGDTDLGDMPPSQTIPRAAATTASSGGGGPRHGHHGHGHGFGVPAAQRLDKRQVEQRIEEDRERHKRLRENIWAVPRGEDAEMWKIWEETSDLGEDDYIMAEEELAERDACLRSSCPHREGDGPAVAVAAASAGAPAANGKHSHSH